MSNMVINVIHKPVSLASCRAGLRREWRPRKWPGSHPVQGGVGPSGRIVGCERASDSGGFIASGARKENLERAEPWLRRPAESLLGPRLERSCARLVPHTCWDKSGTHFSLPAPLAAKLSHASLSGLLGA